MISASSQTTETKVTPVSIERLKQIVVRLMLHFPLAGANHHRFFNYYVSCLKPYPEDLLCAAYQHVLRHHKTNGLPKISDLLSFMDPEMNYRLHQRKHTQAEPANE